MRSNILGQRAERLRLLGGVRGGQVSNTLSGTYTIDLESPQSLFLDPGGSARTVLLPPATGAKEYAYTIINTADVAGETLTVKDSTNTVTFGVIGTSEVGTFFCDGVTWYGDTTSDLTALSVGGVAADRVTVKGIYKNPSPVSVSVPSITDPDIARVQVDVAAAFTMAPAVGDAVIAIPLAALPTNARLQGAWVYQTDGIEITFGSEGGSVVGAARNFDFLIFDLT